MMRSLKRTLGRLRRSLPDPEKDYEAVIAVAMQGLTDSELTLLHDALERGFDPREEQQDMLLSPDEWAAYERFLVLYADAQRRATHLH